MAEQPTRPELNLEPQLRVKRLNRLAVLALAAGAIVVLWAAYFVLSSRAPITRQATLAPPAVRDLEQAAIERLARQAAERVAKQPERPKLAPPAAPVPSTPTALTPEAIRARQQLHRAYDSDVLVPGFDGGRAVASRSATVDPAELMRAAVDGNGPTNFDGDDDDPNLLDHKDAFLRRARERRTEARHAVVRELPSPFVLQQGTLIPAILTGGIHSELPGQITAMVRRNVYDSVSGRHLLLPQGARLVGSYDNRIAWGQKRVLFAWHRLIFPDGRSLDLEGMPGADLAGRAGVRDKVNNHFVRTFGSALLLSAISAGAQLSQPRQTRDGDGPSASQVAAAALGQELGRVATDVTRRNLRAPPTLEIRPGTLFHVEVTADLVLPGPYPVAGRGRSVP